MLKIHFPQVSRVKVHIFCILFEKKFNVNLKRSKETITFLCTGYK